MKTQPLLLIIFSLLAIIITACTPETAPQTIPTPTQSETAEPLPPPPTSPGLSTADFIPTATAQETAVPSSPPPTEPPQPTTTDAITWQAQPVLVAMQDSPGFVSPDYAWGIGPQLLIYADGTLIYSTWGRSGDENGPTYWQMQLSQPELCNILSRIDASGFFDLSDDDYPNPNITDSETTYITVNSWRSNTYAAYALDYAVNYGDDMNPPVAQGLKETYQLLASLEPEDAVRYQPESVSLLVAAYDYDRPVELWPLTDPDLEALAAGMKITEEREFVFEGQTAENLTTLFTNSLTKWYGAGGNTLGVTIRPLFPYEIWEPVKAWGRISQFETTPTTDLTCPIQQ